MKLEMFALGGGLGLGRPGDSTFSRSPVIPACYPIDWIETSPQQSGIAIIQMILQPYRYSRGMQYILPGIEDPWDDMVGASSSRAGVASANSGALHPPSSFNRRRDKVDASTRITLSRTGRIVRPPPYDIQVICP